MAKVKKPKKVLSPASRRKKGHNTERQIAQYLRENGFQADRNLEYQTHHKGDIVLRDFMEFVIEIKNQAKPPFKAALEQAEFNIGVLAERKPEYTELGKAVAICKIPGEKLEKSIVLMRLEEFVKYLKDYAENKKNDKL
jgi:Holliday junction resolvase